jgi:hypothetical protein
MSWRKKTGGGAQAQAEESHDLGEADGPGDDTGDDQGCGPFGCFPGLRRRGGQSGNAAGGAINPLGDADAVGGGKKRKKSKKRKYTKRRKSKRRKSKKRNTKRRKSKKKYTKRRKSFKR